MTYALTRYKSYQEYLDDETLSPDRNYRLLSTGELIEVSSEDDMNMRIALRLLLALAQLEGSLYAERLRTKKEMQVPPVGDKCVNRVPDLMVLQPEHLEIAKQAVLMEMAPPLFIAEVVSPGGKKSDNYLRDYVWKRQQYEQLGISEYWIIAPHRDQVTVLTLVNGQYESEAHRVSEQIVSTLFPTLQISVQKLLGGSLQ
ncbi:Uma2 family endonuclease [cf. Phormidesmis sp. LEGE 11477]|uniref:Uma2 family endonuclease n=1 Tax=cf. Phormidesmis sp. LEGE 11477 TaxID=1828680 RepID=UPI00187E4BFE|nr:Uma2 family endonuclease [cf. Phormidesmis sp. LEGE 11477]MBE9062833.1 Uma2 family endonuclease [cf. Phormidesmis sp. LEGE 11477]